MAFRGKAVETAAGSCWCGAERLRQDFGAGDVIWTCARDVFHDPGQGERSDDLNLVPADKIETIVGMKRDDFDHYGRADSTEKVVYILHSRMCQEARGVLESDLRQCPYSRALADNGILPDEWIKDQPVLLSIRNGHLMPEEKKA